MKTAVIYTSHHGTTRKVAGMLSNLSQTEVTLFDLKEAKRIAFDTFDQVIIGGSIHAGQIQKRVKKFCEENTDTLLSKPLGLFLCCMEENEKATLQFEQAFPESLRNHAKSCKLTGGEILFERMNFLEKFMMKKIAKTTASVYKIREDRVKELVSEMGM
jgi:menaquinone-dependent protoporphyrinogen oxidase